MKIPKGVKIVFGVIGTIFVGALSNGVWENLFRPGLTFLKTAILNLTSLGINSFKDDIYKEIAKGFYEKPSLELVQQFAILFVGFALMITVVTILKEYFSGNQTSSKHVQSFAKVLVANRKLLLVFTTFYIIFASTVVIVYSVRMAYINEAIANFEQAYSIALPHLEDKQEKYLISNFAQIGCRSDYEKILNDLRIVAQKNGLKVPKFNIW